MHNQRLHSQASLLLAVVLALAASTAAAQPVELKAQGQAEISAVGDVTWRKTLSLPLERYTAFKANMPNPYVLLRDAASARANEEIAPGAVARYDDAASAVVLEYTELGGVKNLGGGLWELSTDGPEAEFLSTTTEGGRPAFLFYENDVTAERAIRGKVTVRLPARARELSWDAERRVARYRLAAPALSGSSRIELSLKVKDRLMTGVYKVYGLGATGELDEEIAAQWVAKAVFKNTGTHAARDLRVRYRLTGYSEWGAWTKFPEVLPGQTVVSTYYPVLDPSIARLTSNAPADVLAEWQYQEADGRERTDSDGKRLTLLGAHEFIFSNVVAGQSFGTMADAYSNAPLLAAFITRDDPVVKEFAALANKRAGGVAANQDDDSALKALRGLYELLLANDITYQSPAVVMDSGVSFDVKTVQSLKYPRDVVRERSGTCIDLAMLYLAGTHAIGGGLNAALALIPGHAFPVVRLPSGRVVGIETTMVGGGERASTVGSLPFDAALEQGTKTLSERGAGGEILIVEFQDLWQKGIANPELEPLPPTILQQWGIREGGPVAVGMRRDGVSPSPAGAQQVASGGGSRSGFVGQFRGISTERLSNGQMLRSQVVVEINEVGSGRLVATLQAQGEVETPQGRAIVSFQGQYQGELDDWDDDEVTLTSTARAVMVNQGAPQMLAGGKLKLELGRANRMHGKEGNSSEGWTELELSRQ